MASTSRLGTRLTRSCCSGSLLRVPQPTSRRIPTPTPASHTPTIRHISVSSRLHKDDDSLSSSPSSSLRPAPGPPRLPREQQAEFERLQAEAMAALSSHAVEVEDEALLDPAAAAAAAAVAADLLPQTRQGGAKPEFEGETNPRTGEVGGPKTEPLRWGSAGDWSYNGKVTDF